MFDWLEPGYYWAYGPYDHPDIDPEVRLVEVVECMESKNSEIAVQAKSAVLLNTKEHIIIPIHRFTITSPRLIPPDPPGIAIDPPKTPLPGRSDPLGWV